MTRTHDFSYHLQDAQGEVGTGLGENPVNFDEGFTRIIINLHIYDHPKRELAFG